MHPTLRVSEIFLSLQGEGTRAGRPCVLIRLSGCNLHCRWCDTEYARDPLAGQEMTIPEVLDRVGRLRCRLVELTGGEPLCQPAAPKLLTALCEAGLEVLLETSGERPIAAIDPRVVRIVDVKCPSSGESDRVRWANLDALRSTDEVKFVCADAGDYAFARNVVERYDLTARCAVLFGAVAGQLDPATLAEWIIADRLDARLQVQLHRILWPGREKGV